MGQVNWLDYCLKPDSVIKCARAVLLQNGDEAFPEMIDAIKRAEREILLEVYSFIDDSIGRLFKELLIQKSKEGAEVFLIYDAIGSILTSRDFFSDMEKEGVNVLEFHPLVPWKPHWNWFKRDHRKLLCIDGHTAFVGGFNISEYDAPVSMGGRGWKDSQVKIEGESAVKELAGLFWETWHSAKNHQTAGFLSPAPALRFEPASETTNGSGICQISNGVYLAIVAASGIRNVRSIRRTYKYAIDRAKRYIRITNAYFLPDRVVYRRLIKAVKRRVEVAIIVPGQTDHPFVKWASWSMFPHMIKNGIKIFEWQGEALHSKTAVIDGIWSSVGSHNLDHRSLHYNMELNANIFDEKFAGCMEEAFKNDLKNSRQVSLQDCKNRRLLLKLASKFLYLFRSWL
ncbi:MAG: hypothetical protein HY746_04545 [Elusimicrobia bacterium]|nr:hypothetical protein [Elusimicrobiota bacterium]